MEERFGALKVLLTHSCTAAMEMAAILADIGPEDEVVMPSFTFVSTANAFVLRGASIRFVDIRPDTLNLDEALIEAAITPRTKMIVPVHYAGVGCEMDAIMEIAHKHNLWVMEDAAQGVGATHNGRYLGTIGHLGAYSFHETKNYISGEGGALVVNDERFIERAEIIREKGTNRSQFFRGYVDKYTWVDIGSSYLPSEIIAAFLYAQLEESDAITAKRHHIHDYYSQRLQRLENDRFIRTPKTPPHCRHNAHMFYILVKDLQTRNALIKHLGERNIHAVFHYVPLHTAPMGMKFGSTVGSLPVTDSVSECLLRLPCYFELTEEDQERVVTAIEEFFGALALTAGALRQ